MVVGVSWQYPASSRLLAEGLDGQRNDGMNLLKFAHKILGKESDVLAWSPDLHSCAMY